GPGFGSDMPQGGQAALVRYVSGGGGLIFTEWILYESDLGRYATLRPLIPMRRISGNSGSFQYHVAMNHPVTAGVSSTFTVESGLTGGHAAYGSELVTIPDGEAVVVAGDYALGHVVEFGMAGNWNGYRPLEQPDLQKLLVNAADWVSAGSWMSVSPASGTVAPGGSQQIQVTADPGSLFGGDYALELAISSNDPRHPSTILPATLHVTGAPNVATSPAALDFGVVQLSVAKIETLSVANRGTARLTVSGLTLAPSDYSAGTDGFSLDPGQMRSVPVTFAPRSMAVIPGSLEIHSDDPDQPVLSVPLGGTGVSAAQLTIAPASLSADLNSGQPADQGLVIGNRGGDDLHFTIRPASALVSGLGVSEAPLIGSTVPRGTGAVAATIAAPDGFGYRWRDSGQSGGPQFDWVEIANLGSAVPVYGEEWNYGPVAIGFQFPFYGRRFGSLRICSNGWLSFTSNSIQFSHQMLPSSYGPENLLAPLWADLITPPASVFYYNDGARLIVEYQNAHFSGGSSPLTFEVLLYPDGRMLYQYLAVGGTQSSVTVGIQNAARDEGLQISYNAPFVRDSLAVLIAAPPPWLSVSPSAGTVAPGAQAPLSVQIYPSGLAGGTYDGQLVVSSDDPSSPSRAIPVALHVTDAPSLAVSPAALDFGAIYPGLSRAETLAVVSDGSLPVTVSAIDLPAPPFYWPVAPFTLPAGGSIPLIIIFTAQAVGVVDGAITLHTNDPIQSVFRIPLHGEGVTPPSALLAPALLQDVLGPAERHSATLTLENRGGTPLEWRAATFSLSPQSPDTTLDQPSLANALAMVDRGSSFVTAPLSDRFPFAEGNSGTSILDGGLHMYETGNRLSTELYWSMPYTDGAIVSSSLYGVEYFTRKYPELFVAGLNVTTAQSFRVDGNLGAAGAGAVDGAVLSFDCFGSHYVGLVKRVFGAGVPSVNHVILLVDPSSFSHSVPSDTHFDQDIVTGLAPGDRLYYLLFAGAAGAYYTNAEIAGVMERFIDLLYPSPIWITVSPAAGTVPPLGAAQLTAVLDSRLLSLGDHAGSLLLETNDPLRPFLGVPIAASVVGALTTDVALVSASSPGARVELVWHSSAGPGARANVERSSPGGSWSSLGGIVADAAGELRFVDSDLTPGALYGYRLALFEGGGVVYAGETWVSVPLRAAFALFGLQPNPALRDLNVAFSLPDDQPASLELLDLAGRRVRFVAVGPRGAGRHVISLGAASQLPGGVYFLRLERAGRRLVAKCVVVR
ncbi:MAG: choice-of-anchor D domain-containing protein, partial [Candidatus Eiseniibacteriota bacterium]